MTSYEIYDKACDRVEKVNGFKRMSHKEIIVELEKEIDGYHEVINELKTRLNSICDEIFTEEKIVPATGEILINKAEFDAAMKKVAEDMTNDPKVEGMAKIIMPLTGMIFAAKMADILFAENKEV